MAARNVYQDALVCNEWAYVTSLTCEESYRKHESYLRGFCQIGDKESKATVCWKNKYTAVAALLLALVPLQEKFTREQESPGGGSLAPSYIYFEVVPKPKAMQFKQCIYSSSKLLLYELWIDGGLLSDFRTVPCANYQAFPLQPLLWWFLAENYPS